MLQQPIDTGNQIYYFENRNQVTKLYFCLCLFPVLQDLSESIKQISSFFGFSLTEAQVQQIAGESTFTAMKQSSANSHGNMGNVIFRKGS